MFESEAHTKAKSQEWGSPSLVGRGIAKPYPQQKQQFESYLKAQNRGNVRQILCYAQRFGAVLQARDATPLVNLQSAAVRRHAMESLSALSKYTGCYNVWKDIRAKYQLHWTNGNESIATFERFFMDDSKSLESMLQYVKQAPSLSLQGHICFQLSDWIEVF